MKQKTSFGPVFTKYSNVPRGIFGILNQLGLGSSDKIVALELTTWTRNGASVAWVSQRLLGLRTGIHQTQVRRSLTRLLEKGLIIKIREPQIGWRKKGQPLSKITTHYDLSSLFLACEKVKKAQDAAEIRYIATNGIPEDEERSEIDDPEGEETRPSLT